jgi:hypothetical protein
MADAIIHLRWMKTGALSVARRVSFSTTRMEDPTNKLQVLHGVALGIPWGPARALGPRLQRQRGVVPVGGVQPEPLDEACPKCDWPILTLKTTKRRGMEKVCPQKECDYAEPVEAVEQIASS